MNNSQLVNRFLSIVILLVGGFFSTASYAGSFTSYPSSTDSDGNYTLVWNTSGTGIPVSFTIKEYKNQSFTLNVASSGTTVDIVGRGSGTYRYDLYVTRKTGPATEPIFTSSVEDSVTTTVTVSIDPPARPDVPVSSGNGDYTVSWDPVTGATRYELQEQTNGGAWGNVPNQSLLSASFSKTVDATYNYQVRACNSVCSIYSEAASIIVLTPPNTPSFTSDDLIYSINATAVYSLIWTEEDRATEYELQQYANNSWVSLYADGSLSKSYSSMALGTYLFRVRACNIGGCSLWTATYTVLVSQTSNITGVSPNRETFDLTVLGRDYLYLKEDNILLIDHQLNNIVTLTRSAGTYSYTAKTCHNAGSGGACTSYGIPFSMEVIAKPGEPGAITTPEPEKLDGSQTVSWGPASGTVHRYQLFQQLNGGAWVEQYSGTNRSAPISDLDNGNYRYKVRACNTIAGGEECSEDVFSSTILVRNLSKIIPDWDETNYGIYEGNFNTGQGNEVLLLGIKNIILLHGDIITPITIFQPINNAIISWDANGAGTYTEFTFDANPADYVVNIGDLSGDGFDEIFLQGKSKGGTSYILSSSGVLVQTLNNGFLNADWSAAAYSANITGGKIVLTALTSADDDNEANTNNSGSVTSLETPITKPTISGSSQKYIFDDHYYSFVPSFTSSASSVTFSVTALPAWMSFNTSTGEISGKPLFSDIGQVPTITLTIKENKTHTVKASMTLSLEVVEPFQVSQTGYTVYQATDGTLYLLSDNGIDVYKVVDDQGVQIILKSSTSELNASGATIQSGYQVLFEDNNADGRVDLVLAPVIGSGLQTIVVSDIVFFISEEWARNSNGFIDDADLSSLFVPANQEVGSLQGQGGVSGGSASYSIPINIPQGRATMQPKVVLNYSSSGGNSIAGVGWSLSAGSSISRCAATQAQDQFSASPQYDSIRDRLCLDGQRLINVSSQVYGTSNAVYRTEIDSFVRVTQTGKINDEYTSFEVISKDGRISRYGTSSNSRQNASGRIEILTWALAEVEDQSKNLIRYYYNDHGDGEYTLKEIVYTGFDGVDGNRKVFFEYLNRIGSHLNTDYRTSYLAGGKTRQTKRLVSIETYYAGNPVRKYFLDYGGMSLSTGRTVLRSIQECAYKDLTEYCLPSTNFDWQEAATKYVLEPVEFSINSSGGTILAHNNKNISKVLPVGDIDGDGVKDWPGVDVNADGVLESPGFKINAERELRAEHNQSLGGCYRKLSVTTNGGNCLTADFNQDGRTDTFKLSNNTIGFILIRYTSSSDWINTGVDLTDTHNKIMSFSDFNGDGWPDLVVRERVGNDYLVNLYLNSKQASAPYDSTSPITIFDIFFTKDNFYQNVQEQGDMDGNGVPDFIIYETTASRRFEGMPRPLTLKLGHSQIGGGLTYTDYSFTGFVNKPETSPLGDVHLFHDVNGDGLSDWLSMNSTNASDFHFEYKINLGGSFDSQWKVLDFNVPTRIFRDYTNAQEPEIFVLPIMEKILTLDYDGDGKAELMFANDVVVSSCVLYRYYGFASSVEKSDYFCDEQLWGEAITEVDSTRQSPINGTALDVSARTYRAVFFDENSDGSITPRIEDTDIIASPVQRAAVDAFGNGLTDVVSTFMCLTEDCRWNSEAVAEGGSNQDASFDQSKLYVNRNIGASSDENGYEAIDVISKVTSGLAVENQWTYRPLGSQAYDNGAIAFYYPDHNYVEGDVQSGDQEYFHFGSSMMVVAEYKVSNGTSTELNSTLYKYRGAVYNNQGRGFQGFRTIIVDNPAGIREVTDFHQKYPLTGKVQQVHNCLVSDNDESCQNNSLSKTQLGYYSVNTTNAGTKWIISAKTVKSGNEMNSGTQLVSTTTYVGLLDPGADLSDLSLKASSYDSYGNVLQSTKLLDNGFSHVKTTTLNVYEPHDTNDWWINKLRNKTVESQTTLGSAVHDSDLDPVKEIRTHYTWTINRQADKVTIEPLQGGGKTTLVDADYNDYGLPNLIQTYESGDEINKRSITTNYTNDGDGDAGGQGSDDGYFVYQITNSLDHTVTAKTYPAHGQVKEMIDANNLMLTTSYDAFGRVEQVVPPTGTGQPVSSRFALCASGCGEISGNNSVEVAYKLTTYQAGTPETTLYKDHLNRVLFARTEGFDGSYIYVRTEYDNLGRKIFESIPSFDVLEIKGTSYTNYDVMSRLTAKSIDQPHNQSMEVTYTYSGHLTTVQSNAITMSRTYAGNGQLMQTMQRNNGEDYVTQYAYDAQGNPIVLQDAAGNPIKAKYNALSQKIFVEDPNMGRKEFTYTQFGEVDTEKDANNNIYDYDYDVLGRLTHRYLGTNLEARFVFDNALQGDTGYSCIGAIDTETRESTGDNFTKSYGYDEYCRPNSGRTTIDGVVYALSTQYDAVYGRVKGGRTVNGLTIENLYNSYGYLTHSQNAESGYIYQKITEMNERLQLKAAEKADGKLKEVINYAHESGQMTSIHTDTNVGDQRHRIDYEYDAFGNLRKQTVENMRDVPITSVEDYEYDDLHRLVLSRRDIGGVLDTLNYDYDAVGNITVKDDYAIAGSYVYGNMAKTYDNAGPNAVRSLTKASGGTATFGYDLNGNMTTGDGKVITYNAFNKPLTITKNSITSTFSYDSSQARYKQVKRNGSPANDEITIYIDKLFEKITQNGVTKNRQYLGDAIITETVGGSEAGYKIGFVHRDRLNSTVTITDHNGNVVDNKSFDPFGKPRKSTFERVDPNNPATLSVIRAIEGYQETTSRGFTDHEHLDDAELIHMNGRVYDYNLGRFLSVDPFIQSPGNSQSLNPYSYILNNPLAGMDPSGYAKACPEGAKCSVKNVPRSGSRITDKVVVIEKQIGENSFELSFNGAKPAISAVISGITNFAMNNGFSVSQINSQGANAAKDRQQSGQDVNINGVDTESTSLGSQTANPTAGGQPAVTTPSISGGDVLKAVSKSFLKGGPIASAIIGGLTPSTVADATMSDSDYNPGAAPLPGASYGDFEGEYTAEQTARLRQAHDAGLAYAADQVANNQGKKTVVIGENQAGRVIPAATHFKALVIGAPRSQILPKFNPGGFNELVALTYNAAWTQGFKSAGYTFLDIGIDKSRSTRSPYYAVEKFTLGNYPKVQKIPWD